MAIKEEKLSVFYKWRQRVVGFYANHFSVTKFRDGGDYLLSAAVTFTTSPPPLSKGGQLPIYHPTEGALRLLCWAEPMAILTSFDMLFPYSTAVIY